MSIGEVGERLRRSTVQISTGHVRADESGTGSGIIWSSDGRVLTNAHVLRGRDPKVELWDSRVLPATVVARDDQRDLALLQVAAFGLPAVRPRTTPVLAGETVIAVGNPLGFTGALSTGRVQAVGPVAGFGRRTWVQAAVRLAPGNSGGPLADASGNLAGINSMITRGGLALAIPTSAAVDFVERGPLPRLGVTIQPVQAGRELGLLVLQVDAGSAAERASILLGDILVAVNGRQFTSPSDLSDAAAENTVLTLGFQRGGQRRMREVVVQLSRAAVREAA